MRDHRDEHEGCKVVLPWLRWCSRYRSSNDLVKMALEDIKTLDSDELQRFFKVKKQGHSVTKHRSEPRNSYIAHRERWDEGDIRAEMHTVKYMVGLGCGDMYSGNTLEEKFEDRWFYVQQMKAVGVLYAYNMFDRRTGKIKLDNLSKLP